MSASLGGDGSVDKPVEGYTTRDGVISPGKSAVMVWQLGDARAPLGDPSARVITHDLPYQLNTWNNYEINVTVGVAKRNGVAIDIASAGLADIPPADRAMDLNALTQLKMGAAASGGDTASGYFDAYHLDASVPVPSGQEFVYRNTSVGAFDTSTFTAFPSIEMGFNRHAQRFNFGITTAGEYNSFFGCDPSGASCAMTRGIDGIRPTQETGYPAQLNHPNLPGGAKLDEIIADNYQAYGADTMEVRQDPGGLPTTTMIDIWDDMLRRGTDIVGTWSSDMHKVDSLDVADRGVATFLRSSSRSFDELMRSLFEGRAYMARANFLGRVVFNLDPGSAEPYPARYPVHLPGTATSVPVHLSISDGIPAGARVVWLVNGSEFANEAPSGSSYEATKQIPVIGAALPYVRAEVRLSTGWRIAMTEPILFRPVTDLPADMSYRVDGVATAGGRGYTKLFTKGIASSHWSAATQSLSLGLENPVDALVSLSVATRTPPVAVKLDGTPIAAASSSAEFDAATDRAGSTTRRRTCCASRRCRRTPV